MTGGTFSEAQTANPQSSLLAVPKQPPGDISPPTASGQLCSQTKPSPRDICTSTCTRRVLSQADQWAPLVMERTFLSVRGFPGSDVTGEMIVSALLSKPQPRAHREGSTLLCPQQVFTAGISHLPIPECQHLPQPRLLLHPHQGMEKQQENGSSHSSHLHPKPSTSVFCG